MKWWWCECHCEYTSPIPTTFLPIPFQSTFPFPLPWESYQRPTLSQWSSFPGTPLWRKLRAETYRYWLKIMRNCKSALLLTAMVARTNVYRGPCMHVYKITRQTQHYSMWVVLALVRQQSSVIASLQFCDTRNDCTSVVYLMYRSPRN